MNAYELADWLKLKSGLGWADNFGAELEQASTMLRQQAKRIEELEKDLALKTRDRDVFCDFTLAYEKRIEELEQVNSKLKDAFEQLGRAINEGIKE